MSRNTEVKERLTLTCLCPKCISGDEESKKKHYHEVKDYHPEIPWRTSKAQRNSDIRDIMKSRGCTYEKALKIVNGEVQK